jgi:alpha-N-arabinofuranosidase
MLLQLSENPSDSEQHMKLSISGTKLSSQGKLWRMAPSSPNATVAVGKKPEVQVEEQGLTAVPETMAVPPYSVNIYSFSVQ